MAVLGCIYPKKGCIPAKLDPCACQNVLDVWNKLIRVHLNHLNHLICDFDGGDRVKGFWQTVKIAFLGCFYLKKGYIPAKMDP